MTVFVALLRAVNVGGTSRLPMAELKAIADEIGFSNPRTYIASGNLVFSSGKSEAAVRSGLEERLSQHMGKRVPVMVRTAAEMSGVLNANPFKDAPGRRVLATFRSRLPPMRLRQRAASTASGWRSAGAKSMSIIAAGFWGGRSWIFRPLRRALPGT